VAARLIGLLLALALGRGATAAIAAAGTSVPRTDRQAELYLRHGLHSWSHVDLRAAESKSAFCVDAAAQSGRSGTTVGSFACVFDVVSRTERHYTFGLRLLWTHGAWRVSPLR